MKEEKWYDSANMITNIIIGIIIIEIILSQSFAAKTELEFNTTIITLLNHNFNYIISLIYFVLLKMEIGKKNFNLLNIYYILIYFLIVFTSFLTVFLSFGINSVVSFFLNIVVLFYMIYVFMKQTRYWKESKLDKIPFEEIPNENYLYAICVLSLCVLLVNLIYTNSFSGVILSLLDAIYIICFGRYIYLYKEYVDSNEKVKNMTNHLFVRIDQYKEDLPKVSKKVGEVKKYQFNFYQKFAIFFEIICLFGGVILGNVKSSCISSDLYSTKCIVTEFNIALMCIVWLIGFIISIFIFGLGHIIKILEKIYIKVK